MKLSELKSVVKTAVREAIQEELKDILLEAVRSPKQVVREVASPTYPTSQPLPPGPMNPVAQTNLPETDKLKLRENMMNVLDGMRPGASGTMSATSQDVPMQVGAGMDTTSANGALPSGNVSMDQIMGIMQSK